jgi:hypothetical protein
VAGEVGQRLDLAARNFAMRSGVVPGVDRSGQIGEVMMVRGWC